MPSSNHTADAAGGTAALRRAVALSIAALSAVLLAACAAPYVPYAGGDASKLRLTLSNGSGFASAASNIRPVTNGACSEPVRVPQLFPYAGPAIAPRTNAMLYPRAEMLGSPDPLRSDTVELRLAPGRYLLGFIAGIGLSNCGVGGTLDLQPGRQYHVDFRFDTLARQCIISYERLDESAAPAAWRPQPLLKAEACNSK